MPILLANVGTHAEATGVTWNDRQQCLAANVHNQLTERRIIEVQRWWAFGLPEKYDSTNYFTSQLCNCSGIL